MTLTQTDFFQLDDQQQPQGVTSTRVTKSEKGEEGCLMTWGEREGKQRGKASVRDRMTGRQVYREKESLFSIKAAALFTIREEQKNPPRENPSQLISNFQHV